MVQLTLIDVSENLTEVVIDKAFKLKTNSEDNIKSIELTRAAPAGEGLISAVYRILVIGGKHTTPFIAKGLARDLLLRKSLDCTKYFKREAYFFTEVLPVLIELQKSLGATQCIQNNIPLCYGCYVDGAHDYILMEDLSESDCISISEKLTIRERDMTLDALAHLHATSLALRVKKPNEFARLARLMPEVYYNEENRDWYSRFLQKAIVIDQDALSQYEDTSSIYYKKIVELLNGDVYGLLIEIFSTRGAHPVFNHGDAWCPNFLCSKNRAVAIDFQLVRCASPATDFTMFLFLCSNICASKEDFTKAVHVYYQSLEYYLKDMGIDASKEFSRDDFNAELITYGKFGLLACLTTIPLLASERCDVLESFESKFIGFETIPLEDLWALTPIKNEEYKMRLVNAVRVAVDVGLI